MNILIDTHVAIWFIQGNKSISEKARRLIANANNEVFLSMTSIFEMAIKLKIEKLDLRLGLDAFVEKITSENITVLPISERYIFEYNNVPLIETHKDPFDRLIIATAMAENLPIVTVDKQFDNYKDLVQIIW